MAFIKQPTVQCDVCGKKGAVKNMDHLPDGKWRIIYRIVNGHQTSFDVCSIICTVNGYQLLENEDVFNYEA